ncbi:hypothetical protein [Quadrisphaera sp. DSM 44207]|uniref:hypothetical protein n=1 Tax=Quadrisphaera sp. DSM 44207 TaxID=1881057 RepID=UPI0008821A73|nr:hypothetical protein [Quadrisphaera sp. DSM 44207]SDQ38647.1 Mut7-C ubiquitin [Quadrisphaera sp. DSM 44207]
MRVPADLQDLQDLQDLPPPTRRGRVLVVPAHPHAPLGHVVQDLGAPLTEVGAPRPPSGRRRCSGAQRRRPAG